jgi:hypothetical protein
MKTEHEIRQKLVSVNRKLEGDITGDKWLIELGRLEVLNWVLENAD